MIDNQLEEWIYWKWNGTPFNFPVNFDILFNFFIGAQDMWEFH